MKSNAPRWPAVAVLLVWSVPCELHAQFSDASARSVGLASSYIARARGYEASFWNPANLGLSDRPAWSVGAVGVNGYVYNNSLSLGAITGLFGKFLDDAAKSKLLDDIRQGDPNRPLDLSFDVGAHVLAASVGRFGFGLSATGAGNGRLTSDAVELLLFGNVGEGGFGKDFVVEGTDAEAWVLSGVHLSYGHPFTFAGLQNQKFAVGATVSYGITNGVRRIADAGSILRVNPVGVDVAAEAIQSSDDAGGHLWSVDLGATMEWGDRLVFGLALANALSNVAWDLEGMEYTEYTVTADFEDVTVLERTTAFTELSTEDQERISTLFREASLPTELRLGGLYQLSPKVDVSADFVARFGGRLRSRWDQMLAVGGEFRPFRFLPLRLGLATSFEEFAYTGGFGLYGGPLRFDFSLGRWGVAGGHGLLAALTVSVWPGS